MSGPVETRQTRIDLVVAVLFAALVFLPALGARDLWNPNEPTYGRAVAEMLESGDWLVPTVGGEAFPEKPILYFWAALVCSKLLGGVSELSLRLPLALAGILSVALLYLLVLPYAGRLRARLAVVLYATTFMVHWGARAVQMDFLVTVAMLAVMLAVMRVLDGLWSPWYGFGIAGLAAGLGFAAKGPVTWVLPGLAVLALLAWRGRLPALWHPAAPIGVAITLAVAAPWFLMLWAAGEGGVIHEVLVRQNFVRYVDAWDHHGAWWYYLYYFWIDMAPWSWFVPLSIGSPVRQGRKRVLIGMAWIWIVVTLLFFSLSASKRSAYILPLAPAVAVLAAGVAERLWLGAMARWRRDVCLGLMGAAAVAGLTAAGWIFFRGVHRYPEVEGVASLLALVLFVGGIAVLAGLLRPTRAHRVVPAIFLGVVLALYVAGSWFVLPAVDRYKSPREFSERVNAIVPAGDALASYGMWKWRGGYRYYTGRSIPNLSRPEDLRAYWSGGGPWLLVEHRKLDEAREVIGPLEPVAEARIGSKTAYLFANEGVDVAASD
jgi:4-amino-4-deoxy-L-arabinose transferase-like glycosyltransferase